MRIKEEIEVERNVRKVLFYFIRQCGNKNRLFIFDIALYFFGGIKINDN